MSFYTLALFIYILGVLGLFTGLGLEWVTVLRLHQAQTMPQVHERVDLIGVQERLHQIGGLLILLAGIYMTATTGRWSTPWILVALGAFVVIALCGSLVDRRLIAIKQAAAGIGSGEPIPAALQARITDPVLWTLLQTAIWLTLGVVFLMTNKPSLLISLMTPVLAVFLGMAFAQPWRRPWEGQAPTKGAESM